MKDIQILEEVTPPPAETDDLSQDFVAAGKAVNWYYFWVISTVVIFLFELYIESR